MSSFMNMHITRKQEKLKESEGLHTPKSFPPTFVPKKSRAGHSRHTYTHILVRSIPKKLDINIKV